MKTQEIYPTMIDGQRYIFRIHWDGFCWIAKALTGNGTGHLKVLTSSVKSSEDAALKLVKRIEK